MDLVLTRRRPTIIQRARGEMLPILVMVALLVAGVVLRYFEVLK